MIGNGSGTDFSKGTVAVTIGGKDGGNTRAERTITAPSNVITLPCEEGEQPLCLVETVSDLDEVTYDAVGATRGTPVYTENFADLFGNELYGTAYKTQDDNAELTDVWGSYLENGGTVNFKPVEGTTNTYYYDYSTGQTTNLHWPDDKKLLFFFQAPYSVTGKLEPKFYADGHIEFDYADPNESKDEVITDGAENQTDILFTSKAISEETKTQNHILLYHALASVKFKAGGNFNDGVTTIKKVAIKNVYSSGHCTVRPNYTEGENTSGDNPSNPSNKGGSDATKSSKCSTWKTLDKKVAYVQTLGETVSGEYGKDGTNFPESFYDGNTASNNYNEADFSKTLQLVPQKGKVIFEITYAIKFDTEDEGTTRTVSMEVDVDWQAGKLYTYALSANELAVDVEDKSEYSSGTYTKSNLTTTNTANTIQYQRVALVANWYKLDPKTNERLIVKSELIRNGSAQSKYVTFTGFPGADWGVGSDGYYYYKSPIKPGKTPNAPLFGTYKLKRTDAGVADDMELEMQVIVQAVKFDQNETDKLTSVKKSWKNVKVNGSTPLENWLSTTPETPSSK